MHIRVPLPPHLEQFVREQLASGLFQTESDVVLAALRLLENKSLSDGTLSAGLRQALENRLIGKPAEPGTKEFWKRLQEQLLHGPVSGNEALRISSERRSPRGLLADVCSNISPDDIKDARREMWSGLSSHET